MAAKPTAVSSIALAASIPLDVIVGTKLMRWHCLHSAGEVGADSHLSAAVILKAWQCGQGCIRRLTFDMRGGRRA